MNKKRNRKSSRLFNNRWLHLYLFTNFVTMSLVFVLKEYIYYWCLISPALWGVILIEYSRFYRWIKEPYKGGSYNLSMLSIFLATIVSTGLISAGLYGWFFTSRIYWFSPMGFEGRFFTLLSDEFIFKSQVGIFVVFGFISWGGAFTYFIDKITSNKPIQRF